MKLLLDTHVFMWLLYTPDKVGKSVIQTIEKSDDVSVSMVSLWELAIKFSKGKLPSPPSELMDGLDALGIDLLTIKEAHIEVFPAIKLPHADPFDQLLIAQSEDEGCSFVTADKQLLGSKYRTIAA